MEITLVMLLLWTLILEQSLQIIEMPYKICGHITSTSSSTYFWPVVGIANSSCLNQWAFVNHEGWSFELSKSESKSKNCKWSYWRFFILFIHKWSHSPPNCVDDWTKIGVLILCGLWHCSSSLKHSYATPATHGYTEWGLLSLCSPPFF